MCTAPLNSEMNFEKAPSYRWSESFLRHYWHKTNCVWADLLGWT